MTVLKAQANFLAQAQSCRQFSQLHDARCLTSCDTDVTLYSVLTFKKCSALKIRIKGV
jgi:hypothetical protein